MARIRRRNVEWQVIFVPKKNRMIFFTNLRTAVLTLAALFIFILFTSTVSHQPHPTVRGIRSHLKNFNNAVTTASMPQGKNAFAVFLSQPNEAIVAKEEDFYFMGIRMLLYQLLHNPETRTQIQAEFVVMVTAEVSDWKRKMLRSEGAIVKEVDEVTIPWIKPGNVRWAHVMDKLHVFELVEYDKILLLDTDIVVLKNLDGVFSDPAGSIRRNLQNTSHIADDEAPQPAEYIMAGNCGPGPEHGWPGVRGDRLNAGFVLLKPSKEMFDHYISVASIEGRFPGGSPEQDLWNYVHRRDKNMPWQQLDVSWTVNSPTWRDVWHGVASVHEKYWRCKHCDVRLRDTLRRSRFKMQGYFEAREELRASLVSQNS